MGDFFGSRFELNPINTKDFNLFDLRNRLTDDSYLTLTTARVLMNNYPIKYDEEHLQNIQAELKQEFMKTWLKHQNAGWGYLFFKWCGRVYRNGDSGPYNSFGNGGPMRVSPVGWIAHNEEEVKILSKTVTAITHNHPEGLKGAECIAMCVYLARNGFSKAQIENRVCNCYYPEIKSLKYAVLVENQHFNSSCMETVPQAVYCFLISKNLEDAIRTAISIGGDVDTISCMTGAIAEAYYQKDKLSELEDKFLYFCIDSNIEKLIKHFYLMIGSKKFE